MREIRAACAQECAAFIFQQAPVKKRERGNNVIGGLWKGISLYLIIFLTSRASQNEKKCVISSVCCGQKSPNSRALSFSRSVLIWDEYLIGTTGADIPPKHSRC